MLALKEDIKIGNNSIIISCNPMINHFLHTLNIYGLLGNHGKQYKLRNNESVLTTIDSKIYEMVREGDYYFSYGNLKIYKPGMDYILDNTLWNEPVNDLSVGLNLVDTCFDIALNKSWHEFYKQYWINSFNKIRTEFFECIESFNFREALKKMEDATHTSLIKDILVFAVEATAESGLKFRDNVCLGTIRKGEDFAFVHEGLHLLLQEKWAVNTDINQIINEYGFEDSCYSSWKTKFEQALVIGLECCINEFEDKYTRNYFEGCRIGDVFEIAYPIIKDYYITGCNDTIENIMYHLIYKYYSTKNTD